MQETFRVNEYLVKAKFEWGWRFVGLCFPCLVVGAAVTAVVCRWGLCPRCPCVGGCLSWVYISSSTLHLCAPPSLSVPSLPRQVRKARLTPWAL